MSDLRVTPSIPHWRVIVITVITLGGVLYYWLAFQGETVAPGVIVRPLGSCHVGWFEKWGGAIVLGCPHTDLIKVWPLPMQTPWYEDPLFPQDTAML